MLSLTLREEEPPSTGSGFRLPDEGSVGKVPTLLRTARGRAPEAPIRIPDAQSTRIQRRNVKSACMF